MYYKIFSTKTKLYEIFHINWLEKCHDYIMLQLHLSQPQLSYRFPYQLLKEFVLIKCTDVYTEGFEHNYFSLFCCVSIADNN